MPVSSSWMRIRIVVGVFVTGAAMEMAVAPALAQRDGWIAQFGTAASDNASGVAVDRHRVYVAGATSGAFQGQTSAGGADVYVRMYHRHGHLKWTRQFGTAGNDGVTAGALDARRNIVVAGGFVRGALAGQTWAGADDAFLRAYDPEGNVLWSLQFGGPANERVRSVAFAQDGSIFVSGQTLGQLTEQPSNGLTDAFVARLSPDGTVQWLRQFGTPGVDEAIGVAPSGDAVYVTGSTNGAFPGQANAGDFDGFAARLTLEGDFEWIVQFGTAAFDATWKAGVVGPTIFVAGNTEGEFPGETSSGGFDALVAALTNDGQLIWTRQFGTSGNDLAFGLAVDEETAVAVGRIGGAAPPGGQDPAADAFTRRYDVHGNVLWTDQFGTEVFDNANDVALEDDDVFVAGTTAGSFPGHANAGIQDAFLKRNCEGGCPDDDDSGDE